MWTDGDLLALDLKYAQEGVHLHQRPFRAALELLHQNSIIAVVGSPEFEKIQAAYARLVPEVNTTWPGMGIGLAASVDQVRKIVAPVVMGEVSIEPWRVLGFEALQEWANWCRNDLKIVAHTSFAVADVLDHSYGINEIDPSGEAATLWRMAGSNLEDVANNLPQAFSMDSILQPICLIVELSLKALLVAEGASPNCFKGKKGHNLTQLAQMVIEKKPHRDDRLLMQVVANLPPYVASRYSPVGLSRLEVVRLATGAQFVLASTLRRVTSLDFAGKFAVGEFPGDRNPLFE